ncbi:N-acetylmuramoyl-L-alanine amidase family protein [Halalkalibacter krulwichiae]|nr:N-acetylmuramoyl-L-alanine amidase [Halalkalibacter krulwichiae]
MISLIPLLSLYYPLTAQADVTPFCDIVIDVGHGGIDGGTSANGILEKDLNLAVGIKLFNELNKKSFNVGITRIDDFTLSDDSPFPTLSRHLRDLKQRKLIADELNPQMFLSLHVNWSKNKTLRGPLIIYQVTEKSYQLANLIQDQLNDYYGVKKYPQKGNPYFLMKHLEMPSIIVELGYISNYKDFQILTEESTQDELAMSIVRAIEEYMLLYPAE